MAVLDCMRLQLQWVSAIESQKDTLDSFRFHCFANPPIVGLSRVATTIWQIMQR